MAVLLTLAVCALFAIWAPFFRFELTRAAQSKLLDGDWWSDFERQFREHVRARSGD